MAARFRAAFALVRTKVSCIHCHDAFSLPGFARHRCPVLQDIIDYIDSRIGA